MQKAYKDKEWYERREYKAGKQSQAEAHEAIRITHLHELSELDALFEKANKEASTKLVDKHKALYTLIYKNSICSQAKDKVSELKSFEFDINGAPFKTSMSKVLYRGLKAYLMMRAMKTKMKIHKAKFHKTKWI